MCLIWLFVSISIRMGRVFNKTWGKISYEILDEEVYERFWWGRKPSSKRAMKAWLGDPDRTQRSIAIEYGKRYNFIYMLMFDLVKLGIIRRFKRED